MKTFMLRKEDVSTKWYLIDAEGETLGKVAAKAAHILRGKHKVTFTPHVNCGDAVIIVNANKVNLTGDKLDKKVYYNHSGFPGGLRERTAKVMKEKYPVEMVERAVKGMLPKNRLGRQMYKKLFVYEDRKSTRLNSSHVAISYAVFCLKKKNIKYEHTHYKVNDTMVH